MHGYDLKAAYEAELVPGAQLNAGQVYTTLDRLHRDELVTSPEVVSQSERPDRKVYSLTPKGRAELQEWLATTSLQDLDLRNETFIKVVVADRLASRTGANGTAVPADPFAVLAAERQECLERLADVQTRRLRAEADGSPLAALLVWDLAARRLSAFHDWLVHCEDLLRSQPGGPRRDR